MLRTALGQAIPIVENLALEVAPGVFGGAPVAVVEPDSSDNVCCILSPANMGGLQDGDSAYYDAQTGLTRNVRRIRNDPRAKGNLHRAAQAATPIRFRLGERLPEEYRKRLLDMLNNVRLSAMHTDEGSSPDFQRIIMNAGGQYDFEKATTLRSEGDLPLNDKRLDDLWVLSGRVLKTANEHLLEIQAEVLKAIPELKAAPFDLLKGIFYIVDQYVPENQTKQTGWANAAAIAIAKAVGIMLLGKIGRNEEKFFLDPAKAISVICHEIGHLVEGKLNPNMLHSGQSGAVGEAYGDLFSLFVTNELFYGGAAMPGPGSPNHRDRWGMGHDFLVPVPGETSVQYLRHFHERAHKDDHPALGNCVDDHHWPQKTDGEIGVEYKKTRVVDDGGEHLDASALNFIHYKMTMAFDGDVKKTIKIFSMGIALSNVARNRVVVNDEIAAYEVMAARSLYGDDAAILVRDLWMKELGYQIPELPDLKLPKPKKANVAVMGRAAVKKGGAAALWQGLRTYAGLASTR